MYRKKLWIGLLLFTDLFYLVTQSYDQEFCMSWENCNIFSLITLLHQDLRNNYLYHPPYVAYDSSPEHLMLNQSISPCWYFSFWSLHPARKCMDIVNKNSSSWSLQGVNELKNLPNTLSLTKVMDSKFWPREQIHVNLTS